MSAAPSTLDVAPRLSDLPGASRLVRIPLTSWDAITDLLAGQFPQDPTTLEPLAQAGIIHVTDDNTVVFDAPWDVVLPAAATTPVIIDLVSVEDDRAWRSRVHLAQDLLFIHDQVRHVELRDGRLDFSRMSPVVTLAVATPETFSATIGGLIPQVPAFVRGTSATVDPPPPADPTARAQVQVEVISCPQEGEPVSRSRVWFAGGHDAEQLVVVAHTENGPELRASEPSAFARTVKADFVAAVNNAVAAQTQGVGS